MLERSARGRRAADLPWPLLAAVSIAMSGLAAWSILADLRFTAAAATAAAAAAVSMLFLEADRKGDRRRFAVLLLDRLLDASILGPLAWVAGYEGTRVAALALACLGTSYLASYVRARGQSLGYPGRESVHYLSGRSILLVIALLTGWVEPALWSLAVVTIAALTVRGWNVARQQRRWGRPLAGLG